MCKCFSAMHTLLAADLKPVTRFTIQHWSPHHFVSHHLQILDSLLPPLLLCVCTSL